MYEMNLRVRYSETDLFRKLHLHHLLDYFQDAATFHSIDLGLGKWGDFVEGRVWYLLAWDVTIYRNPGIGEYLRVVTDPYKMKGFYGYRRFFLKDEKDTVIAAGESIWVLMDIAKKLPVRISEELTRLFVKPESDGTIRIKRKLSEKGEWERVSTIEITDIFLDSNQHVNNVFYVQWARMVLAEDLVISRLRTDYRQSSFEGDTLYVDYCQEGMIHKVRFTNQDDVLIALVEMEAGTESLE